MLPLRMTIEQHVAKWKNCQRCPLCRMRDNVVIGRGSIPAQVAFIGEAPGDSEDASGEPFRGPAGFLLDKIIARGIGDRATWAITNVVACRPTDAEGNKDGEPEEESIRQCTPRLQEIVRLFDPKLIVCVGKLAKDWLEPGIKDSIRFHREIPQVHITHPAAILRQPIAMQGLSIQRAAVIVYNGVERHVFGRKQPTS